LIRHFRAAVILCLFAAVASADQISAVLPSQFRVGQVEEFLTIQGSGLLGLDSTMVVFSGPGGTFSVEASIPSDTSIVTWIPIPVLLTVGTWNVTVEATDGATTRTIGPGSFQVVAEPVTGPPLLAVPEVVVAEADSPTGANVTYIAFATSLVDPSASLSCDHTSGSRFPLDTTVVHCTATDSFGSTSGSFFVVVTDTVPPVLTVPSDISTASTVVSWTATAVDAIDGTVPVTCDPTSGSTFPIGVTVVTCSATDLRQNVSVATFKVFVLTPPTLTLPADITKEATGPSGATVTYTATADQGATPTCSPASGSVFPLGVTTVQCSATSAGGTSTGSFKVTVVDTTPPTLVLPTPAPVEATGPTGAMVTFVATATDIVDGSDPVVCLPLSGSTFALGTTLVQCSATDAHSNTAHGSFSVTVRDTTPPQVTNIAATPSTLWPPNHVMTEVNVTVVAFDVVDPAPVSRIVAVSSNQPVNGTGDGDTSPDWEITGPLKVNLRAERQGGEDRIYTITVETRDFSGNAVLTNVTVVVSHSRGHAAH
jgi:hypothetical protein